ncbi:MAG: MBL fold metallo-hydrolase [Actinobacteria bacterium]|nr:MBL fold metallo-hydrolase [Actinomycetota bacterium]
MEQVAEGIRRFRSHFVNWYLVEEDGRLAAIDAGLPPAWDDLQRALGGRSGALEAIVLTHAHVDHLGFAERARRELGAVIYAPAPDADLIGSRFRAAKSQRSSLRYARYSAGRSAMAAMLATHAFTAKPVRELRTFVDGEALEGVPGKPRVVATPGHTWGHSAVHLPERDVLFTGDALVTCNPFTGERGPRIIASGATANSPQALLSLDRIAETGAGTLLPGHGDPWRGGASEAARLARAAGSS